MISLKHKFIYLHPARTGGTSISYALVPYCDNEVIPENDTAIARRAHVIIGEDKENYWFNYNTIGKHDTLNEYYNVLGSDIYNFTIICSIRNPFNRLVSFSKWAYFGTDDNTLERCVDSKVIRPCMEFVKVQGTVVPFDTIRYCDIQNDFSRISKKLGLPELSLPWKNRTFETDKNAKSYFKPSLVEKIRDRFKEDFERFNYEN